MILIFIIIGLIYSITIGFLLIGNVQLKSISKIEIPFDASAELTGFTIIVPFRNEARHLPELIRSIKNLEYPTSRFEVLFIDDSSEDDSVEVITKTMSTDSAVQFKVIANEHLSKSPKKDAITTGIGHSKFEWILTTDADCILPTKWMKLYHLYIDERKPKFLAGPVLIQANASFIQVYQQIDGLSLQGVAMGSFGLDYPLLCNGANLGYLKSAFHAVNGFKGNDHLASGDDVFIMEKIRNTFPHDCHLIRSREAIVSTMPVSSWKLCIDQRIRWASKTSQQKNIIASLIGVLVFLANSLIILGLVLCFFNSSLYIYYFLYLMSKLLIDFIFIMYIDNFFGIKLRWKHIVLGLFLYPWITSWIVLNSLRGTYRWKGRKH